MLFIDFWISYYLTFIPFNFRSRVKMFVFHFSGSAWDYKQQKLTFISTMQTLHTLLQWSRSSELLVTRLKFCSKFFLRQSHISKVISTSHLILRHLDNTKAFVGLLFMDFRFQYNCTSSTATQVTTDGREPCNNKTAGENRWKSTLHSPTHWSTPGLCWLSLFVHTEHKWTPETTTQI